MYIRINELKNYLYCPRISFYTLCLHIDRETGLSRMGIEAEIVAKRRMKRRKHALHSVMDGVRYFDVSVFSHTHRLVGKIDEVVESSAGLYLVDYKDTDKDYGYWKVQMAAYALCMPETDQRPIVGCYIYSIPTQTYTETKTTKRDHRKLTGILGELHAMTRHEICPPPTPHRAKCRTCQYTRFCNDVF